MIIISAHFAKLSRLYFSLSCIQLQLPIVNFKNSTVSDMHYHIKYMYVKYQLNRNNRFVKTANKKNKLHKIATYNSNFEKSLLSAMHHSASICKPNWKRIDLIDIVQPFTKIISTSDGQTLRVMT